MVICIFVCAPPAVSVLSCSVTSMEVQNRLVTVKMILSCDCNHVEKDIVGVFVFGIRSDWHGDIKHESKAAVILKG